MWIIQAWFQDGWKQVYGPRLSPELQLHVPKYEPVTDIQPSKPVKRRSKQRIYNMALKNTIVSAYMFSRNIVVYKGVFVFLLMHSSWQIPTAIVVKKVSYSM